MSVEMIYRSQYIGMLEQREKLIIDLESMNNQLSMIRRQARKDGIDLDRLVESDKQKV